MLTVVSSLFWIDTLEREETKETTAQALAFGLSSARQYSQESAIALTETDCYNPAMSKKVQCIHRSVQFVKVYYTVGNVQRYHIGKQCLSCQRVLPGWVKQSSVANHEALPVAVSKTIRKKEKQAAYDWLARQSVQQPRQCVQNANSGQTPIPASTTPQRAAETHLDALRRDLRRMGEWPGDIV